MPERWETEVRKLRSLTPPDTVPEPRRNVGVAGPPMRQRAVAAIVALAVFAGGGVFVWQALGRDSTGTLRRPSTRSFGQASVSFPDVGRIRCTKNGTHVQTGVVQPQQDGVHLLINNASTDRWIEFGPGHETPMTVGSNWSRSYRVDPGKKRELVILAGPGVGHVSCSQDARRRLSLPLAGGGAARLQIVDPEGLWGPPKLACRRSDWIRFDVHGYSAQPSRSLPMTQEIRMNLPSIRPSDDVRIAGYPGAQYIWKIGPWYVVVRDGKSIASVWFWQVDGAATINTCPGSGITRPGHPWNES